MDSLHDLEILLNSGQRLIVLETEREGCFIDGFRRLAEKSTKAFFQWTVTQGLLRLAPGFDAQPMNKDINQLFAQIHSATQPGVYVLVDFHHYLEDPVAIRHLKDVYLNSDQHALVLLSQKISVPMELELFATRFHLPLPTHHQLERLVNDLAVEYLNQTNSRLKASDRVLLERLLDNLCGLSYADASRLVRHAIFNDGILDERDVQEVMREKFALLNRDNVLSLELDFAEFADLAGMRNLRRWLEHRRAVFKGEVKLPSADVPRGCLLLGVQGCGKSLAAKAVAGSWGLPLLRLDFGTLYNRFYGQTEENLRAALATAEKMQPCVLWLDEIEKGMSAVSSSDDVSKRLLATFLTWMAERKSRVFVVATANDVSALPPELMRKGRFDEVFFVDLPNVEVREAILRLHLQRRNVSTQNLDLGSLAMHTEGFSGAELEQLVVAAVFEHFAVGGAEGVTEGGTKGVGVTESRGAQDDQSSAAPDPEQPVVLGLDLLMRLASETKPLSVLMQEKVAALRAWALPRTVPV